MDRSLDLEGRMTFIAYEVEEQTSTLKVMRNFEQALRDTGFEPLFQRAGKACGTPDIWDEALDQVQLTNGKQTSIRYVSSDIPTIRAASPITCIFPGGAWRPW